MTNRCVWLGAAMLTTLFAMSSAWAGDPLKPYVVLILDTSGSMDASTGSGPPSCGGTDTRIEHATCAINRIVNSYGDMVFALARFREVSNGTFTTSCDANGDLNGNPNGAIPIPEGGDQCETQGAYCGNCDSGTGTPTTGLGSCTTADREFQLLTPLVDGNNQLAAHWTDRSCGTCGAPPPGSAPTAANEIWGVSPNTFTPLAAVMNGARSYWRGNELATDATTVLWPSTAPGFSPIVNDPTNASFLPTGCNPAPGCTTNCCASQCRPYITILLTDGAETCTTFTNTTAAASSMLTTDLGGRRYRIETKPIGFGITPGNAQIEGIAHAGGAPNLAGNQGYYAANESELQLAISSILDDAIKTEVCNNLDDDCDVLVDEDFPDKNAVCDNGKLGVCRRTGTQVCRADGTGLECTAPVGPDGTAEVCNNLDDDCDGLIDEGLTGCTCAPQGEQCDNMDNDCDGMIDEGITRPCGTGTCLGIETCTAGVFEGCTAPPSGTEVCNGLDDNCDGIRDGFNEGCSTMPPLPPELFPIDDPRNNPGHPTNMPIPENICHPGTKTCPANVGPPNSFGGCIGEQMPLTEVCNNLDDDCDNLIDEGTGGADCSTACGVGTTVCVNGTLQCNSVAATDDDTCDGNDDDCDGMIDEDYVSPGACGAGQVCNGLEQCINGMEVCIGDPISQESCNCADDDCDLEVDEGALCPPGATCTNCQCAFACTPGEFPCPLGKTCSNGFCIADPCFGVSCPDVSGDKQVCKAVGNTGTCVAACDPTVITCPTGEVCIGATGECKPDTCETFPERCSATENCINGTCVSNPCQGVTCPTDQYCVAGQCFASCADVECPTGQRCRMGVCEADPCGGPCPFGQVCIEAAGECVSDPCRLIPCPQGQICNPQNNSACEDDPCVGTMCPGAGQICKAGTCFDEEDLRPDAGIEEHVTTGGGGGCSTTGGDGGLLLGLALLLGARRRRTRTVGGCS